MGGWQGDFKAPSMEHTDTARTKSSLESETRESEVGGRIGGVPGQVTFYQQFRGRTLWGSSRLEAGRRPGQGRFCSSQLPKALPALTVPHLLQKLPSLSSCPQVSGGGALSKHTHRYTHTHRHTPCSTYRRSSGGRHKCQLTWGSDEMIHIPPRGADTHAQTHTHTLYPCPPSQHT